MVIERDVLMLINFALFGGLISFLLVKQEILLLFTLLFLAVFYEGISSLVNGTYIIFYLYGLMLVSIFINKKKIKSNNVILTVVLGSFILSSIPLLVNGSSIPIIVTSILKRFGFIIPFIFALNIFDLRLKYEKYINRFIITVLIINFLYAIYQYSQGIFHQDDITGFLGDNMTGIFIYLFMFYQAIVAGMHYQKKISNLLFITLTIIPIIYSAIAEVKIGFISIAISLLVYFLFLNRGGKSYFLLLICSFIFIWAYAFFISLYPSHDFLSKAFLESYLVEQSYGSDGTINRVGFRPTIDALVFSNNTSEILFGKGLGTGNPSELDLLMGEVYRNFDYLKYSWFAMPYLYIETGWIGTASYLIIYFIPLMFSIKEFKKEKSGISVVLILMGITNFIFFPYNAGIFNYGVTTIYWLFVALLLQKSMYEKVSRK